MCSHQTSLFIHYALTLQGFALLGDVKNVKLQYYKVRVAHCFSLALNRQVAMIVPRSK